MNSEEIPSDTDIMELELFRTFYRDMKYIVTNLNSSFKDYAVINFSILDAELKKINRDFVAEKD